MAAHRLPFVMLVILFAPSFNKISAADPDILQDLCVADLNSTVKVNGFTCKSNFTAKDFSFSGLTEPGAINNSVGSVVTTADVQQIPGLNTLGVAMARIDYATTGGLNPPHTHPRATEMIYVFEGELYVAFITTANVLISKTIKKADDNFVFRGGLVHFQNNGKVPATIIASTNGQLPGPVSIAATLVAASPPLPDKVLTKAFQIGTEEVDEIKARLAPRK